MREIIQTIRSELDQIDNEPFQHILSEKPLMLLMASYEQEHRVKIHLVKLSDFNKTLPLLLNIARNNNHTELNIIVQFLNNNVPHYGFLKIFLLGNNEQNCLFVDASTPKENFFGFIKKLKTLFNHVYTVIGCSVVPKIQLDTKSCPIFSLFHAQLLASNKLLTDMIMEKCIGIPNNAVVCSEMLRAHSVSEDDSIDFANRLITLEDDETVAEGKLHVTTWKELPPEMIWPIQSLSAAQAYISFQANTRSNASFADQMGGFLKAHTNDFTLNGDTRKRNLGILHFYAAIKAKACAFMNSITDEQMAQIIFTDEVATLAIKCFESCRNTGAHSPTFEEFRAAEQSPVKLRKLQRGLNTPSKTSNEPPSAQRLSFRFNHPASASRTSDDRASSTSLNEADPYSAAASSLVRNNASFFASDIHEQANMETRSEVDGIADLPVVDHLKNSM